MRSLVAVALVLSLAAAAWSQTCPPQQNNSDTAFFEPVFEPVFEPPVLTFGDLQCTPYCFQGVEAAEFCGALFAGIGSPPYVLNLTRTNNSLEYVRFFATAAGILNDFQTLSALVLDRGVPLSSYCQQEALKLLCRYVFPTCDPAFREPTYQPICRRACLTLENFLCSDFFVVLKGAIQSNLLDTSIIDPPLCDPLEDVEAGGVPDCISASDGGELPPAIITGECYSGSGRGYNGTVNTTENGKDCQRWVSGEPHQFILPPSQYVELEGGHNYCRNPGARGQKPWCFTTDNDTRWEYCNVTPCAAGPQCEFYNSSGICRLYGSIGYDYIYTDTTVKTEKQYEEEIERVKIFVEEHGDQECADLILDMLCHYYFPACDFSQPRPQPVQVCREFCLRLATNGSCAGVYSALVSISQGFNRVSLPDCGLLPLKSNLSLQCYENVSMYSEQIATATNEERLDSTCYSAADQGLLYAGNVNRSATGKECLSWDLRIPYDERQVTSLLRRDLIGHSSCRNPEQRGERPWCYVMLDEGVVGAEYCDVPVCIPPTTPVNLLYIVIPSSLGAIILVLVAAVCCLCCCLLCRKRKARSETGPLVAEIIDGEFRIKCIDRPVSPLHDNHHYVTTVKMANGTEVPLQLEGMELPQFPRDDIVYIRDLGQGNFGLVVQAEARGIQQGEESTTVAVKVLKEGASAQARQEFFKEAALMHEFNHPNILRLLGVCIEQEPLCMMFEYMELGDLNNFLRKNDPTRLAGSKQSLSSDKMPSIVLNAQQLVNMAVDVAAGLEYLFNHHYIHRDLATRNCLINSSLRVKIADFGLSQDVYSSDYYRLGESSLLPIRWMPPEAIVYGKFSLQSDVWSFGIIVWELFSYGQQPYLAMTNEEVCQHVRNGYTLACPEGCPEEIYDLMIDCWAMEPSERPTPGELHIGLRRWNLDVSATLSLQRKQGQQPNYQNMAVIMEYDKQAPPPRRSTMASPTEASPPPAEDEELHRRSNTLAAPNPQALAHFGMGETILEDVV